jgi:hypothetical protein
VPAVRSRSKYIQPGIWGQHYHQAAEAGAAAGQTVVVPPGMWAVDPAEPAQLACLEPVVLRLAVPVQVPVPALVMQWSAAVAAL